VASEIETRKGMLIKKTLIIKLFIKKSGKVCHRWLKPSSQKSNIIKKSNSIVNLNENRGTTLETNI